MTARRREATVRRLVFAPSRFGSKEGAGSSDAQEIPGHMQDFDKVGSAFPCAYAKYSSSRRRLDDEIGEVAREKEAGEKGRRVWEALFGARYALGLRRHIKTGGATLQPTHKRQGC